MGPNAGDSTLAGSQPVQQLGGDSSAGHEDTEELWTSILKGVASSKMVPTKKILILGDKESGKTTLLARLKGSDDEFLGKAADGTPSHKQHKNDLALSYNYFDIKDDESEDADDTVARLGLYQLAGSHKAYHSLLRFVLNTSTLADSLVMIVLDWSRPWTFMETLQRWVKVLEEGLEVVKKEGASGSKDGWTKGNALIDELKESLERFLRNYTEPPDAKAAAANPANISTIQTVSINDSEEDLLPLKPGTLTTNLGIPLIVVCTKSDHIFDLKEQQFLYIQQSLRTICLKYGAALFYTSTRQPTTFATLRSYVLHRLLSNQDTKYAFNVKAVVSKPDDMVVVPTGWDSWNTINVDKFDCEGLSEGWDRDMESRAGKTVEETDGKAEKEDGAEEIPSARKIYGEVIRHENVDKSLSVQSQIVAEDEQDFFERHEKSLKSKDGERVPTAPPVVGPIGAAAFTAYTNIGGIDDVESKLTKLGLNKEPQIKPVQPLPPGVPTPNGTPNGAPQSQAPGASQNDVLANFFHQLLTKKGNSPNAPPGRGGSSQTSPNSSNSNLSLTAKTASIATNGPTRKLVKEELEKITASTSATAGTVGK